MVLSKLDSSISYEEFKELNKDDKDLEASLFIINVNDIPIMATIGNEKYTYVYKHVQRPARNIKFYTDPKKAEWSKPHASPFVPRSRQQRQDHETSNEEMIATRQ